MTNDVEKLILISCNRDYNTNYEENVAYLFYKEIWKFLLNANKYDYNSAIIKFKVNKRDDKYYIYQSDGISFELKKDNYSSGWYNFYDGCEEYYIKNVLNTNIDFKLLTKLLYIDGFNCNYFDDEDKFLVQIEIDKFTVNRNIDNILLKNKILRKEM